MVPWTSVAMITQKDTTIGIQLETPALWIPWGIGVREFAKTFTDTTQSVLRLVAPGYYVARCQILQGLVTHVGFHFEPANDSGHFNELELFDNGEEDIEKSYRLFHDRLVQAFGKPNRRRDGAVSPSMPECEWNVGPVTIVHYVVDRFGPEEHLRFRKGTFAFGAGRRFVTALVAALLALVCFWWSRGWQP